MHVDFHGNRGAWRNRGELRFQRRIGQATAGVGDGAGIGIDEFDDRARLAQVVERKTDIAAAIVADGNQQVDRLALIDAASVAQALQGDGKGRVGARHGVCFQW